VTLGDVFDAYMARHVERHTAEGSRANIRSVVRRMGPVLGNEPVARARAAAEVWAGERSDSGTAPSTIRKELLVLKAALSWAVDEEMIARAPKIPLPRRPEPKTVWLDQGQALRLLEAAGKGQRMPGDPMPRVYVFCLLALATGARRDALEGLQWPKVDLDRGLVDLRNGTATAKRRPVLPLPDRVCGIELMPVLRELKERARREWVLFRPGSVWPAFVTARKRAGLEHVTPHSLRHTKATWMLHAGQPIWQVAQVLGDSVATVERTYAHAVAANLVDAVNSA
jgi:integrase